VKLFQVLVLGMMALLAIGSLAVSQQDKPLKPAPAGVFANLKVGQSIEFLSAAQGATIRTFEDDARQSALKDRILEIGSDYIVVAVRDANADKDVAEIRLPTSAVMGVVFVRK
jgi:predicted nuclease of restriction endonuclease-like (RecB) superfamily